MGLYFPPHNLITSNPVFCSHARMSKKALSSAPANHTALPPPSGADVPRPGGRAGARVRTPRTGGRRGDSRSTYGVWGLFRRRGTNVRVSRFPGTRPARGTPSTARAASGATGVKSSVNVRVFTSYCASWRLMPRQSVMTGESTRRW